MKYLVILILLIAATVFAFDGICPECRELGLKSTVTGGGWGTTTLMYCGGGHWDEGGNFHPPEPCNTTTRYYECSNGHSWAESEPSF